MQIRIRVDVLDDNKVELVEHGTTVMQYPISEYNEENRLAAILAAIEFLKQHEMMKYSNQHIFIDKSDF